MSGATARTLDAVAAWLSDTPLSRLLQNVDWLVPAIQTLHILCVALVISSVVMLTLGAFGLYGREQVPMRRQSRFLPNLRWGLLVLLATGALMVVAEPDRALPNPVFQLKMILLIVASGFTALGARRLTALQGGDSARSSGDFALRALTCTALLLWISVLISGRWIAYSLSR